MALSDDIRILSGVPLFEGFTAEPLRLLAFGAERLQLDAGGILYREGEPAGGAFVLAEGRIELLREEEGRTLLLGEAGPGALLGELALIVETRRPSGARALAPSLLLSLDRKSFRRILEEYPEIALSLRERLARQFVDFAQNVERLAPRFAD